LLILHAINVLATDRRFSNPSRACFGYCLDWQNATCIVCNRKTATQL